MNPWTPWHRARQAEIVRRVRPWEHATGPRTPEGIERVRRAACKGYKKRKAAALARALRELSRRLDDMQR